MKVFILLYFRFSVIVVIGLLVVSSLSVLSKCICCCYLLKLKFVLVWNCCVSVCDDMLVQVVYFFNLCLLFGFVDSVCVILSNWLFCGIGSLRLILGRELILLRIMLVKCFWDVLSFIFCYVVVCVIVLCSRFVIERIDGLLGSLLQVLVEI